MNLEQQVIANIKKYRKLKRLSQEKLAEKCNTSTSYIGLVETGKKVPRLSTIERIAEALDIKPYLLFIENIEEFDHAKVDFIMGQIRDLFQK